MQSFLFSLVIIGALVALIGCLTIFNDWFNIPLLGPLKGYEGWLIAVGLIVALGISVLFFSNNKKKK